MQLGVELLKKPIYADCALPPEHVFCKLQPRKNCPSLIHHGTHIYDQCLAAWLLNFERAMPLQKCLAVRGAHFDPRRWTNEMKATQCASAKPAQEVSAQGGETERADEDR